MNTATALTGGKSGTKWIGSIVTAASAVSAINPALLPPSWLPYFGIFAGLVTMVRGAVNTSNINNQ